MRALWGRSAAAGCRCCVASGAGCESKAGLGWTRFGGTFIGSTLPGVGDRGSGSVHGETGAKGASRAGCFGSSTSGSPFGGMLGW